MNRGMRMCALMLLLAVLVASCSTTTHFNSQVPVDVFVDGEYVGRTPAAEVSLSDAVWANPSCRAQDAAGNQYACSIAREFKVGTFIGGLFLWPLLLWTYGPKSSQNIAMMGVQPVAVQPVAAQPAAAPAQTAAPAAQ